MANPLTFKPKPVDPRQELQKRLDEAPILHAESLLVAYDLLETAHKNGTLDLVQGLIGGRDIIAGKIAEYAKLPGGIAIIRNALAAAKTLTELDPEVLDNLTSAVKGAYQEHAGTAATPNLFTILRRALSADSLRALSLLTLILQATGKAIRTMPTEKTH